MSALTLLTDALATYRAQKLVRDDKITEPLRERVVNRYGSPEDSYLSYLITCPWCLSMYAGALLALGRIVAPRTTDAVSRALALSAVAGLLAEREDAVSEIFRG